MTVYKARFAPSPTGFLHVGGARSALYNWLFIQKEKRRNNQASFLLRIEDTDYERNRPELINSILDSLQWLGINWDEGPFYQSDHKELHIKAALELFEKGSAYWCKCTPEEISQRTNNKGYDGHCRSLGLEKAPGRILRFLVPENQEIIFEDLIRGEIAVNSSNISDFGILKADMQPLFILANAVDDIEMRITHVIRGEEHIPNTFKYILVSKALGKEILPTFAHLPLIVDEKRQKLSKRKDNVSVEYYKQAGYLSSAMVNYLALLGWGPKDGNEIMNIDKLIDSFELKEVNKAPAFFDQKKLLSINAAHIRNLTKEEFLEKSLPFLKQQQWFSNFNTDIFLKLSPLIQQRSNLLTDAVTLSEFLFIKEPNYDTDSLELMKRSSSEFLAFLRLFIERINSISWDKDSIYQVTKECSEAVGNKLNKLQAALRIAVTGKKVGIPLFEALEALGRDVTFLRVKKAIMMLEDTSKEV